MTRTRDARTLSAARALTAHVTDLPAQPVRILVGEPPEVTVVTWWPSGAVWGEPVQWEVCDG